jgi:alkylation response protein AidB-like acyl-CoA dehydrogenase
VDFTFDDTQQAVANLAATVLRSEPDHSRVEHVLASPAGYDETAWKAMAQSGLLALALPERLGGDGCGVVEVGAVLREVGRQTLPLPALATLALGVLPVLALADAAAQDELLAEVADGRILTGALRDAPRQAASAQRDGTDIVVRGTKIGVPYAEQAHRALVATDAGVVAVDPHADGVTLVRTPTATGAPEYTVRLDGVRVPSTALLGPVAPMRQIADVGAAAVADGVLAGALALTAEHVRTREQFDKPLATFQAVAGQVADIYVTARTINLVAVSASWRLAAGLDAADDSDIAAYWVAGEVLPALQVCHHLHGGLGVDITYPLHRYYSHGKDLARFVGGAAARLDQIGARCSSS